MIPQAINIKLKANQCLLTRITDSRLLQLAAFVAPQGSQHIVAQNYQSAKAGCQRIHNPQFLGLVTDFLNIIVDPDYTVDFISPDDELY